MNEKPRYLELDEYRRRLGVTVEDCWVTAFALGGHNDLATLVGFFEGSASLPEAEVDVLAAALEDRRLGRMTWHTDSDGRESTAKTHPGLTLPTTLGDAVSRITDVLAQQRDRLPEPTSIPNHGRVQPILETGQPMLLQESRIFLHSDQLTSIEAAEPIARRRSVEPTVGSALRVDSAVRREWEVHNRGDELLVLLSGTVEVAIDRSDPQLTILERPYQGIVVPRGRWHRHCALTAATNLLYVTPVQDSHSDPGL